MAPIRTRFAPSPTGRLHLGNIRTAVFNWLVTRRHGGAFVLRIEDTDVDRNVEGSEAGILDDIGWLGLHWDEGPDVGGPHGPYRQSERLFLHQEAAERLLSEGSAYRCFCTEEELAGDVEETPGGTVHRYPGRCRQLAPAVRAQLMSEGRPHAVRFALPENPVTVPVEDEIRGSISFWSGDFDDFVILRRDGRPTYNFAVVVDDAAMEITHVIRGVDHLSNTPKQALLFEALGHTAPVFAHLPTVLAPTGGRLSKRTGAMSIEALRQSGYHPDGVVNYLSLLGWSSPDEREVFDRASLEAAMSLDRIGVSDTKYDPEKLLWMSGQHIQEMDLDELSGAVTPFVDADRFPLGPDRLRFAVEALRTRLNTFGDIAGHLVTYLYPDLETTLKPAASALAGEDATRSVIQALAEALRALEPWTPESVNQCVRETGKVTGTKGRDLYHPLRRALSGLESGPDIGLVMVALGRDEVLVRLSRVLGR